MVQSREMGKIIDWMPEMGQAQNPKFAELNGDSKQNFKDQVKPVHN